jgi:hypothetical protein
MVIQMLPGLAALLEGCANDCSVVSVACLKRRGSDNKFIADRGPDRFGVF